VKNNILEINPQSGQISKSLIANDGYNRQPKTMISIDSANNRLLVGFDISQVPNASASGSIRNAVYSIDKSSKSVVWSYEVGQEIVGNMITIDVVGNIYFSAQDLFDNEFKLYSLDKNGNLRWVFTGSGAIPSHPVIGKDGGLYQIFGRILYKLR